MFFLWPLIVCSSKFGKLVNLLMMKNRWSVKVREDTVKVFVKGLSPDRVGWYRYFSTVICIYIYILV